MEPAGQQDAESLPPALEEDGVSPETEPNSDAEPEEEALIELPGSAGRDTPASSSSTGSTAKGLAMMFRMFTTVCVLGGFHSYLASATGGGKPAKLIESISKNVLSLLRYAKISLDGTDFTTEDEQDFVQEVWDITFAIATRHVGKIEDHLSDLKNRCKIQEFTQKLHVNHYKSYFAWFDERFEDGKLYWPFSAQDRVKLESTLRNLASFYNRKGNQMRNKRTKSIEESVADFAWPENGFHDLQTALTPHILRILKTKPELVCLDKKDYDYFMKVLICAFYSYHVNGRIGGVTSIKLSQAEDIYENGMAAAAADVVILSDPENINQ